MILLLALILGFQTFEAPAHGDSDNENFSYFVRKNGFSKFDVCIYPTNSSRYIKLIGPNPREMSCEECECVCECEDKEKCTLLGYILTTNNANEALAYNSVLNGKECLKLQFDFDDKDLCRKRMYLEFKREDSTPHFHDKITTHKPKHVIDPRNIELHSWKQEIDLKNRCD